MTLAIAAVALLAAAGLTWLYRLDDRPLPQEPLTPQMVRALLDALLYQGVVASGTPHPRLEIRVRDDPRVFHLVKYRNDSGEVGIRAELPRNGSTELYYESYRRELESLSIHPYESDADVARTLVVDLGRDVILAERVVYLLFERVFRVQLATQCVGYLNKYVAGMPIPRLAGIARPSV